MQAFMWQEHFIAVAKSINACMKKMNPSLKGQAEISLMWLEEM